MYPVYDWLHLSKTSWVKSNVNNFPQQYQQNSKHQVLLQYFFVQTKIQPQVQPLIFSYCYLFHSYRTWVALRNHFTCTFCFFSFFPTVAQICWQSTRMETCPTTCVKTTRHWTSLRRPWPTEVTIDSVKRRLFYASWGFFQLCVVVSCFVWVANKNWGNIVSVLVFVSKQVVSIELFSVEAVHFPHCQTK